MDRVDAQRRARRNDDRPARNHGDRGSPSLIALFQRTGPATRVVAISFYLRRTRKWIPRRRTCHDHVTMTGATRPGLAKTRGLPLVLTRRMTLVRAPDPRWRELFDRADTISEGSVRDEAHGQMWYGSTSMILPTTEFDSVLLAALAKRDVHVRVRALRTAHREACCRAPSRLGRFACEIQVAADVRGVRIDVDVQAPLIDRRFAPKAAR